VTDGSAKGATEEKATETEASILVTKEAYLWKANDSEQINNEDCLYGFLSSIMSFKWCPYPFLQCQKTQT
jgi:hypothetical protein